MLLTKCIKAKPEAKDGMRISVMSKHTLSDGQTPDPDIQESFFDEWRVDLAPPRRLVGAYYRQQLPWKVFEENYIKFLRDTATRHSVLELASLAIMQNITIMCIEAEPEFCHRRLLAQEAILLKPELNIEIR